MKLKSLVLSLALVLFLSGGALAAPMMVHFFVIPATVPAAQRTQFNEYLVRNAGGFTISRSMGGAMGATGPVYHPDNLSYTVAAPRDMSAQIKDYLKQNCGQNDVFMLVWPAERVK